MMLYAYGEMDVFLILFLCFHDILAPMEGTLDFVSHTHTVDCEEASAATLGPARRVCRGQRPLPHHSSAPTTNHFFAKISCAEASAVVRKTLIRMCLTQCCDDLFDL